MSKTWSSYDKHQQYTDSWRTFLTEGTTVKKDQWEQYLAEERVTLTEQEKEDLLQEIDFLKNVFSWMTGKGKKKGASKRGKQEPRIVGLAKAGGAPEPEVTFSDALQAFASRDPKTKAIAAKMHFSDTVDADDHLKKLDQLLKTARKSQDPVVTKAAKELETVVKDAGEDGVVDTSLLGDPITNIPEPGPGEKAAAPTADTSNLGDPLTVSGTEIALMHNIGKQRGGDIFAVTADTLDNLGAANRHPEVGPIIKIFKGKFFKQLQNLKKRANIAVAEAVDDRDPISGGTRGYMKGQARAGKAMSKDAPEMKKAAYVYVKPMGGKPPRLVRDLQKSLQKALMNPSEQEFLNAAADVSAKIKDPKQKKQYESRINKDLETQPEKRIAAYNQNATEVIDNILKMATNTLKGIVVAKEPKAALPENLQEKLISAITEAIVAQKLKQRENNE